MTEATHTPEPAPAAPGHNRPPLYDEEQFAELKKLLNNASDQGGVWLEKTSVDSEDEAGRLTDFRAGVKELRSKIDKSRVEAKRPHDDAAKKVQEAFKPLLDICDRLVNRTTPILTDYMQREQARAEAERQAAARAAAEKQAEAERQAAAAAARNDVVGEQAAEQARAEAEKAAKAATKATRGAGRVASASGAGRTSSLRTVREARVDNALLALADLRDHHPEHFQQAVAGITQICTRIVQAKGGDKVSIRGVTISETKKAV